MTHSEIKPTHFRADQEHRFGHTFPNQLGVKEQQCYPNIALFEDLTTPSNQHILKRQLTVVRQTRNT